MLCDTKSRTPVTLLVASVPFHAMSKLLLVIVAASAEADDEGGVASCVLERISDQRPSMSLALRALTRYQYVCPSSRPPNTWFVVADQSLCAASDPKPASVAACARYVALFAPAVHESVRLVPDFAAGIEL